MHNNFDRFLFWGNLWCFIISVCEFEKGVFLRLFKLLVHGTLSSFTAAEVRTFGRVFVKLIGVFSRFATRAQFSSKHLFPPPCQRLSLRLFCALSPQSDKTRTAKLHCRASHRPKKSIYLSLYPTTDSHTEQS